ncbi:hypothetical protein ESY86_06790 [Subsaximicrobium wynnwilliamsii]|uniref:Uncharacterized protein n=1 Tax=Subsaximicrobium wynnwilliamsii TaxID=291179 RepID=A0A5C6ZLU0_9FLAO|nr:hypothetical protein [Subsaximicrobium wynnwilliamsii]TXD84279.1 hypothetical protein ESY87_07205 [Subsaximicrobium wynnwilliamsii]TXD89900.1 hypothetical protein ESY86_06790 [Subsaximicrobium wynnwilliamsii]TXE03991.1 hypothetical protein ESY88_07200 [Subsaximicrobium wynnwilliamsii]
MKNFKYKFIILTIISLAFLAISCSNDDDNNNVSANVTLTEGIDGDIGGDFTGNGGSTSETFNWQNGLSTADYNADITASSTGLFQMIIKDSEGTTVLDRSLNGNVEPDSFSGVTSAGQAGMWTVTITVSNFNGDGSFSLSAGD